jgi:hypothetical protein
MRERRNAGESLQSFVERQIREAQEEGAFEGLRGAGKPLPELHPEEEAWWIRKRLREERLDLIPESLEIRREAERVLASLDALADERLVRQRLGELDARIRKVNRTAIAGPPTSLSPIDVEEVVRRWREGRGGTGPRR